MSEPKIVVTESDFMDQVTQMAEMFGWAWVHFRPGMTTKGWRTPVSGPLGKGWPDLVLVRDDRIIYAELKRDGQNATPDQIAVLTLLGRTGHAETYLWKPAAFDAIAMLLK